MTATLVRSRRTPQPAGRRQPGQRAGAARAATGWSAGARRGYLSEIDATGGQRAVRRAPAARAGRPTAPTCSPWSGQPGAAARARGRAQLRRPPATVAYASWNGATAVASWRVLAGGVAEQRWRPLRPRRGAGFETAIALPRMAPRAGHLYVEVQALDASGAVIGASAAVKRLSRAGAARRRRAARSRRRSADVRVPSALASRRGGRRRRCARS